MYARLINNILYRAPKKLIIVEAMVYNPTDIQLQNAGYKPVEMVEQPDDAPEGKHYESQWVEQNDAIVQDWYLVDDPDDIDPYEALEIILGGADV